MMNGSPVNRNTTKFEVQGNLHCREGNHLRDREAVRLRDSICLHFAMTDGKHRGFLGDLALGAIENGLLEGQVLLTSVCSTLLRNISHLSTFLQTLLERNSSKELVRFPTSMKAMGTLAKDTPCYAQLN